MLKKLNSTLLLLIVMTGTWAQTITVDQLVGEWTFTAWAEKDEPQNLTAVGVKMEFRSDGTIINILANGEQTEATYSMNGDTITYVDERSEQAWKILTFVPGEKLVVENSGTLMFLERS